MALTTQMEDASTIEEEYTPHCFEYEVARYLPRYYNEKGHYVLIKDWCSYFDIGKTFNGKVFTVGEYLYWEKQYLGFLFEMLEAEKIDCLYIKSVWFPDGNLKHRLKKLLPIGGLKGLNKKARYIRKLHIGQRIPKNRWAFLFTLMLREFIYIDFRSTDWKFMMVIEENFYIWLDSTIPEKQLRRISERYRLYLNPRSYESEELYKDRIL